MIVIFHNGFAIHPPGPAHAAGSQRALAGHRQRRPGTFATMSTGDPAPAQLIAAVRRALPTVRRHLEDLVAIPSVSADPGAAPHLRASAEAVAELLRAAGMPRVDILSADGGQPAVLASRPGPPGAPTVLLYAHHDVQPPGDPAAWDGDPFVAAERGGRLYGRGAADDKAGIAVHLAVLHAYGDRLPVGVTVLVEGEEEIGSPTLPAFLAAYSDRVQAEVVVLADSANAAVDTPALTTSLRGGANVTVEVRALDHGVHSGLYGGAVPDALTALCRLLATLHDEHGDVAVPGLVRTPALTPIPAEQDTPTPTLTEEELRAESGILDGVHLIGTGTLTERLWTHPAISVTGLDAPPVASAANMLIPSARAKVSLRIAPGDDAARAREALISHLMAHAPWGVKVIVEPSGGTIAPYAASPGGVAYRAAHAALAEAWGTPAVDIGVGGSMGIVTAFAETVPGAELLITGVEDSDTRAHAPNESLDLKVLERACVAEALLLHHLANPR
jgi:acetylornithine deacetylase/succinyl-diaminopimelate desuccinylase-like protein